MRQPERGTIRGTVRKYSEFETKQGPPMATARLATDDGKDVSIILFPRWFAVVVPRLVDGMSIVASGEWESFGGEMRLCVDVAAPRRPA